jgi:hypothetical protein
MGSKIGSLDSLTGKIDEDLSWRTKELSAMKTLIEKSHAHNKKRQAESYLLRAGVTILYAHWEGFVKQSALYYIQFISERRLKYKQLSDTFLALSLKYELDQVGSVNNFDAKLKIVQVLRYRDQDASNIDWKNAINTESNLNSKVLQRIIKELGLDYSSTYKLQEKMLDERLVNGRNQIAHGQYLMIDYELYIDLYDNVTTLMNCFREDLQNHACLEKYMRSENTSSLNQ